MDLDILYTHTRYTKPKLEALRLFDHHHHTHLLPFVTTIYIIYIETDIIFSYVILANCLAGNTNLQSIHRRSFSFFIISGNNFAVGGRGLGADLRGVKMDSFLSLS